jgi:hypothetical protein
MGLLVKRELDNGLTVEQAYGRIDTVSGYKGKLTISVNFYASRDAFLSGKNYLQQELYDFVPSVANGSENFIRQGYFEIKKLGQFKGNSDVFELGQE